MFNSPVHLFRVSGLQAWIVFLASFVLWLRAAILPARRQLFLISHVLLNIYHLQMFLGNDSITYLQVFLVRTVIRVITNRLFLIAVDASEEEAKTAAIRVPEVQM